MTKNDIYFELKQIYKLLWKENGRTSQGTVFETQFLTGNLIHNIALETDNMKDLQNSFPFIFKA